MNIIYGIRWIIVLYAYGTVIYNSKLFERISEGKRFIVGVTSAPLFLALYNYLLGLIWPGAPVFLFRYGIIILAAAYLFYHKNYKIAFMLSKRILASGLKQGRQIDKQKVYFGIAGGIYLIISCYSVLLSIVILLILSILYFIGKGRRERILKNMALLTVIMSILFVLAWFISTALAGICDYVPGWDESHYGMQARFFVEDRNSWEIDNYTGDKDGAVLPDDHGPLWELIMADAGFFADDPINDELVRACHSFIGLLFFLAIYNLGNMIAGFLCGALSVALLLFYRNTMSFVFFGSREGFRFIALYLFVIFIYCYICSIIDGEQQLNEKGRKGAIQGLQWFASVLIISYLGMNGHGSNVVIMFGIMLFYTCIAIWKRIKLKEYIITGGAALIGVLLALEKNIRRYFIEGQFTSSTTWAFRGTKAAEMTREASEARGDWGRIWSSYTMLEFALIAFGIVSFIFVIVICLRALKKSGKEKEVFIHTLVNIGIAFGMLLPLTGLYDGLGYEFSKWFVEQTRYRMYFLLICSIMGGVFIVFLWKFGKNLYLRGLAYIMAIAVCGVAARKAVTYGVFPNKENHSATVAEYHLAVSNEIVEQYHTTGNIFVSDQIVEYFFGIPTKLGFTEYNHPILVATTRDEIEAAIKALDLEVFVFGYEDEYFNYDKLPFFEYLKDSPNVEKEEYNLDNGYEIEVYKVNLSDRGIYAR